MIINKKNKLIKDLDDESKQKKLRFENMLNKIDYDYYKNHKNNFFPKMNHATTSKICSYKSESELHIKKEKIIIDDDIKDLDDLIGLINKYKLGDNVEYNINMESLHRIKTDLIKLNLMIGMDSLKTNIVDQILYYIQNLHDFKNDGEFMHSVIYGPPGTGKTEIAKIMGGIFCKIGILKKNTFKKVTRSDLIAGYLGQTALKTRDVLKDSLGGVLFIDEAYALGNNERRDSFAKECIDTLCEGLSHHKNNLMVIIAGYEEELRDCFFSYNEGLESRFVWRFKTDDCNAEQLMYIFFKKTKDAGWCISTDSNISVSWFESNIKCFKHYGRSMEVLFTKTKIAHSKRIFCKANKYKKQIILEDLEKGLEMYNASQDKKNTNNIPNTMYM